MSKSNSATKVLRVAYRRIQRGWTKGTWAIINRKKGGVTPVCIEGAVFGFGMRSANPACKVATDLIMEVINDRYPNRFRTIPEFNDHDETTHEMAQEVVKLALIRAETGGLLRDFEEDC
jgi:hypothetical protein